MVHSRCLGAEFLPFLQVVMEKLLLAITQDVQVNIPEGADPDETLAELEQRSDVEMIETSEGSWIAVRSAAVEEQASACQLLVLLVEKMQEHFYPFVEQSVIALQPLLDSPHEDVRSYAMVAFPELVRTTAKATIPDRTALVKVSDYALGLLVKSVERESALEMIMTGLQAIKQILFYMCTDWVSFMAKCKADIRKKTIGSSSSSDGSHVIGNRRRSLSEEPQYKKSVEEAYQSEPPTPTPATSIRTLNAAQMEALTECSKIVLRDSIQRRAVMRAEAKVSSQEKQHQHDEYQIETLVDEEDAADEKLFMRQSMELHYNVSELICAIFRTHAEEYLNCYMTHWHEMIRNMSHRYCLKEDRQLAFFIMSDVIEFGLPVPTDPTNESLVIAYLEEVIPSMVDALNTCADNPALRQTCAYAVGIAAERFPKQFAMFAAVALQALANSVKMGEDAEEGELRGSCTDNCVSAVGIILESMESLLHPQHVTADFYGPISGLPLHIIWGQWLDYLPLQHDQVCALTQFEQFFLLYLLQEESCKVTEQLCRLLRSRNRHLLGPSEIETTQGNLHSERGVKAIFALLQSLDGLSGDLKYNVVETLQLMKVGRDPINLQQLQVIVGTIPAGGTAMPSGARNGNHHLLNKLQEILTTPISTYCNGSTVASSPLATAPIQDVLMRNV